MLLGDREDVRKDPAFRAQFHAMCANVGVDPLASNKGAWAQLLGFGDFYYELGVQVGASLSSERGARARAGSKGTSELENSPNVRIQAQLGTRRTCVCRMRFLRCALSAGLLMPRCLAVQESPLGRWWRPAWPRAR